MTEIGSLQALGGFLRSQTKVAMPDREPFTKRPSPAEGAAKKKAGREARRKLRSDKRQNLPEGTAGTAAPGGKRRCRMKSAIADIGGIAPLCNAKRLMQGLR
jgi:hypothetical protein